MELDGTTKSPDAFGGDVGKELNVDYVSDWDPVNFKKIKDPKFKEMLESYPDEVVEDLSHDQHYAYRICMAIMTGHLPADLALLEVGPLCHARWLTLACRILRYYASVKKPCKVLRALAEFCIHVYFPSWFEIKRNKTIISGTKNFFNIMERVNEPTNTKVKIIAHRYLQINGFFAHPEMVLISMLGDEDDQVRHRAVNKVQEIRRRAEVQETNRIQMMVS